MHVHIGCSGYAYDDWKGAFYPADIPKEEWLGYYARHFDTVEINATFYSFPKKEELEKWAKQTTEHFRFSVKANRYLTHMKKLNADGDFRQSLATFQKTLHKLGDKLGCVLWQLPGNLHKDTERIEALARELDSGFCHVMEFRHPSWFEDGVYEVLEKHGLTYCMISAPEGLPENAVVTSNTAYLRMHGKKQWYHDLYSTAQLKEWRKRLTGLNGIDHLYVYFNNDAQANAVKNAREFQSMFQ